MGIEKTSLLRAKAGIRHALLEKVGNGNCGYPKDLLITFPFTSFPDTKYTLLRYHNFRFMAE
jgi:hypothetical protein